MTEFRDHWNARTSKEQEAAYQCWRANHERYIAKVFANAEPDSKEYRAGLRTEAEVRELWFRRYRRPDSPDALWTDPRTDVR